MNVLSDFIIRVNEEMSQLDAKFAASPESGIAVPSKKKSDKLKVPVRPSVKNQPEGVKNQPEGVKSRAKVKTPRTSKK